MRAIAILILLVSTAEAGPRRRSGAMVAVGATLTAIGALATTIGTGFAIGSAGCPNSGDCGSAMLFVGTSTMLGGALASAIGVPLLVVGDKRVEAAVVESGGAAREADTGDRLSSMEQAGVALVVISSLSAIASTSFFAASYSRSPQLEYILEDEGAAGFATALGAAITAGIAVPLLVAGKRARNHAGADLTLAPLAAPNGGDVKLELLTSAAVAARDRSRRSATVL